MTDPRRPVELTCDGVRDLAASFVLGALDDDDTAAVRAHLVSCAEPHAEFAELGGMLPVLHASVPPIEPPPALKDRIMAAAAADLESRRGEVARADVASLPPAEPTAPAVRRSITALGPRQPRWSWAVGMAAVLAIVVLGGLNLSLQSQLSDAQAYQRQVAAVIEAAARPGALTAVLTTESGEGPSGLAAVTTDGVMRLAMRNLAPTTGREVYEAWVIARDDPPVPLGGFQVGSNGVGYLEADELPTEGGMILALTREPGPGATAPSSDPVSLGTARSSG